jgi:hypothetical protein
MFTKTLFLGIAAFSMMSFSNPKQTTQEDKRRCPINSSEVVASCARGCYSIVILGQAFSLSDSELQEATRRLQDYCDISPIVQIVAPTPGVL